MDMYNHRSRWRATALPPPLVTCTGGDTWGGDGRHCCADLGSDIVSKSGWLMTLAAAQIHTMPPPRCRKQEGERMRWCEEAVRWWGECAGNLEKRRRMVLAWGR
ncbi:UNVERIFIED_CONTAM: hypothetical protein Sindi_1615900 [Sesamum indicum]